MAGDVMGIKRRIKKLWQIDNHCFGIVWNDDKKMQYKLENVQKHCPCALCHTTRNTEVSRAINTRVSARSIESVGAYALKIKFEEGCSLGIYDFDYLYTLGAEL